MTDRRISELPTMEVTNASSKNVVFIADMGGASTQVSMDSVVDMVRRSMGYLEKPLIKCRHCGQWGAAYCACRYCGAPIDPT